MIVETPEIDKITIPTWMDEEIHSLINLKPEFDSLIDNEVWITATKRKIPVKSMATNHINNCIRCWNGLGKSTIPTGYLGGKEKWLKIFHKELSQRN